MLVSNSFFFFALNPGEIIKPLTNIFQKGGKTNHQLEFDIYFGQDRGFLLSWTCETCIFSTKHLSVSRLFLVSQGGVSKGGGVPNQIRYEKKIWGQTFQNHIKLQNKINIFIVNYLIYLIISIIYIYYIYKFIRILYFIYNLEIYIFK